MWWDGRLLEWWNSFLSVTVQSKSSWTTNDLEQYIDTVSKHYNLIAQGWMTFLHHQWHTVYVTLAYALLCLDSLPILAVDTEVVIACFVIKFISSILMSHNDSEMATSSCFCSSVLSKLWRPSLTSPVKPSTQFPVSLWDQQRVVFWAKYSYSYSQ